MVIESYIISAKDGIYPAGTLDDSFDTILEQTNRMKDKVSSLLKYVTISTMDLKNLSLIFRIYFTACLSIIRHRFIKKEHTYIIFRIKWISWQIPKKLGLYFKTSWKIN